MDIRPYKKDLFYSYALGAFPTMELLKHHPEELLKIYVHTSFKNQDVLNQINEYRGKCEIEFNDKMIAKLSQKENCFVIGVFKKYASSLKNDHHIVLVNPSNMGNLGTILRSASGFCIENIAIIRPGVDLFDPKVIRASMGAVFSCNISYFSSYQDYLAAFPNHRIYTFMLQAKRELQSAEFDRNRYCSLVFGNESSGLDPSYLDENSLIIRHSNAIDSLNLPISVAIGLYEFRKQIGRTKAEETAIFLEKK